jgi:ATP-dependent Clp protease ATP-binding subunit ClpA
MLSAESEDIIQTAFRLAHDKGHELVSLEHLVLVMSYHDDISNLLEACDVDLKQLRTEL